MDEGVSAGEGLEPVPDGTGQGSVPHELNRPSAMQHMTCIEDLRLAARRRVPRAFFGYAEAGSYSEETLRANRADMERIRLRQRVLVDISERDTSTKILGEKAPLPVGLAPIGLGGLQYGNGEILACRAAQAAGIPYTLSTMSICSIEDVAAAVDQPFWFQLYIMKDRGFVRSLIERAAAARCSALVLTVDLQVLGQRHADIKNGLSVPPAFFGRSRPLVLFLYLLAAKAMIVAGLITRFGNQPINAIVMTWSGLPPTGWEILRDRWWTLHQARLAAGTVAELFLIAAIFVDRS